MCIADCNHTILHLLCEQSSKMSKLCVVLGVLIVALQLGSNGVKTTGNFTFVNV